MKLHNRFLFGLAWLILKVRLGFERQEATQQQQQKQKQKKSGEEKIDEERGEYKKVFEIARDRMMKKSWEGKLSLTVIWWLSKVNYIKNSSDDVFHFSIVFWQDQLTSKPIWVRFESNFPH